VLFLRQDDEGSVKSPDIHRTFMEPVSDLGMANAQ
jgi:hypothetical protein